MSRSVLTALALLILAAPARADRIAPIAQPVERALRAPVVVIGKVTAIEKETIDAPLWPGATNKVAHKIAVVKIETNLAGAANVTHIKVGFVTPEAEKAGGIRVGRGPQNPELKVDQEWMFFLTKNEAGNFHAMPYMTPPLDAKSPGYKEQVESVKKVLAAVADPAKAMKAEKAEDRFNAAVAIITKFRTPPEGTAGQVATETLTAEESRPILKSLSEASWKPTRAGDESLSGYRAFAMLGLTETDGWKPPAVEAGKDFFEQTREAYLKWLDGPGKDYKIKKLVPKKGK